MVSGWTPCVVWALAERTLAEEQLAQLAAKVTRRAARELGLATRTQQEERRWRAQRRMLGGW